jgi:predicted acyltransferase
MGFILVTSAKISLGKWLFNFYLSFGLSPVNASLLGALLFTGFWLLVVSLMYRRNIIIKI